MPIFSKQRNNSKTLRIVLEVFTPERVREIAERIGLEPSPGAATAALRRQITRSGRMSVERLLQLASVFELQDVCRNLDLSTQGRDPATLRQRILHGPNMPVFQDNNSAEELPLEVQQELRARRSHKRMRRFGRWVQWSLGTAAWSAFGGSMYYALVWILAADPQTRLLFAAGGAVTTGLLRLFHLGRFWGIVAFTAPLTIATLFGEQHEFLELPETSAGRLMFVWGIAMATGAIMGIAQDLTRDDG
ncbi:MAG: hypothetical protein ACKVX7_14785 [Planctomycetota bacterium]